MISTFWNISTPLCISDLQFKQELLYIEMESESFEFDSSINEEHGNMNDSPNRRPAERNRAVAYEIKKRINR